MRTYTILSLILIITATTSNAALDLSDRAMKEVTKKSYAQKSRMTNLQHTKEKRLARQQRILERQEKRRMEAPARRAKLQTNTNRVAAQRTRADHVEQVRTVSRTKHLDRAAKEQVRHQKESYIEREKQSTQQLMNMHNAAREALRRRRS